MASTYEEDLKKKNEEAAKAQQQSAQQTVSANNTNLKGLSQLTQQNLNNYQSYTPSASVTAAQNTLNALNTAKPGEYTSQYDAQIQGIYDKIMNRQDFSYDLNADMLYQQYKDQYQTLGKQAMQDTMGQAAALTGGYGNSYAATAGNQAYQGYLQQLNNVIPDLYAQAYSQYNQEGQDLLNQYNTALSADEAAYGRHQDQYNKWLTEYQLANDVYNQERNWDYGQYQDNLAYWTDVANQENANYWQGRDQAYNTALAMLQSGKLPNDDLLYAAGLSAEDAETLKALYAAQAKASRGGGGSDGKSLTEDQINMFNTIVAEQGIDAGGYYLQQLTDIGHSSSQANALYGGAQDKQRAEKKSAADKELEEKMKNAMRQPLITFGR